MKWRVPATNLVCYNNNLKQNIVDTSTSQLHKIVSLSAALQHLQLRLQACDTHNDARSHRHCLRQTALFKMAVSGCLLLHPTPLRNFRHMLL